MNKINPTTRADMVAMQMTDMWTEFMLLCYGDKFVRTYLPVSYVYVQYYFFLFRQRQNQTLQMAFPGDSNSLTNSW